MLQQFSNLKVGTRIIAGYVIALVLMAVVGGVGIWRLSVINNQVDDLANNLAIDQVVADSLIEHSLLVRFFANKYIRDPEESTLATYNQEWNDLVNELDIADVEIQNPARVAMLDEIHSYADEYEVAFTSVVQLIADRADVTVNVMDVQGPLAEEKLRELRNLAFADDNLEVVQQSGDAQAALLLMRFNAFKYLQTGDPSWVTQFDNRKAEADTAFAALRRSAIQSDMRTLSQEASAAVEAYAEGFSNIQADFAEQNTLSSTVLDVVGPEIRTVADEMATSVKGDFEAVAQSAASMVTQTIIMLLVIIAVAAVIGIGLGIIISGSITKPLSKVANASKQIAEVDLANLLRSLQAMAKGDLTSKDFVVSTDNVDIHTKDELGMMAQSFNNIIDQMGLTGDAFTEMSSSLQVLIGSVQQGVSNVTVNSEQLNEAASQAGQATAQIAETMGHVATANTQQSHSLENTRRVIEMQTQSIIGIAQGAQKQANAVDEANRTLSQQLASSVEKVRAATEESNVAVGSTTQETESGAKIVEKTVNGMHSIAQKTDLVAERVTEMGERSKEIGSIVNAIDAIAERTNLLALNAAIEAARAGEHGKGFAVVADEVRKLAEQASRAVGEINGIVHAVQQTADQAVSAMGESREEVNSGMEMANETGMVLERIRASVQQVNEQIRKLSESVVDMTGGNEELGRLMTEVAAIVEENTASAEQLANSSDEVMQAVEDLSAISEENSASAEQVSASTEEVSAQVDQTVASAGMLARMAQELMQQISRFKVDENNAQMVQRPKAPVSNSDNGFDSSGSSYNGSSYNGNGSNGASVAEKSSAMPAAPKRTFGKKEPVSVG